VGVWGDAQIENRQISLAPGDSLVAFTDGVTEAQNAKGELFGEQRLERLLHAFHGEAVEEIRRRIHDEVNRYRESTDQDDVTLLVLRRTDSNS